MSRPPRSPRAESRGATRLAVLTILLAAPAEAAELQALILTGATTEAAAKPLLEAAQKRAATFSTLLVLPPGFPRLVQSDTLVGLKPGFWIVLAGFCKTDDMLTGLKALDAGAYAKTVTADEAAACPAFATGWSAATEEVKVAQKRTLRGVLFDPDDREDEWKFFATLREKNGAVISELALRQGADSPCLYGGRNELTAKGATLVLKSTDCLKPRGCPNPGEATISITVSAPDGGIETLGKTLVDPGYRGCRGE
ncbi:MAG: hypothetical protein Q8L48_27565 [Archangium sp.]|nr:hypothetical protein [Archangium sp.]